MKWKNQNDNLEGCAFSLGTAWRESKNFIFARKSFGLTRASKGVTREVCTYSIL